MYFAPSSNNQIATNGRPMISIVKLPEDVISGSVFYQKFTTETATQAFLETRALEIRAAVIGADDFIASNALGVTWQNVKYCDICLVRLPMEQQYLQILTSERSANAHYKKLLIYMLSSISRFAETNLSEWSCLDYMPASIYMA